MTARMPARLWGDDFELVDLLQAQSGGMEFAVRDFGLLTLAARLSTAFHRQLVFKGGFVLRHVHDIGRFSKDVDATRHAPPRQKLDATEVAQAIRAASVSDQVRFNPGDPKTDNRYSLDFDSVRLSGQLVEDAIVQVEVSYREGVVDEPDVPLITSAFYEPFEILAMRPHEMGAEKLRTLAQRTRSTDLADLAVILDRLGARDADIGRIAPRKFDGKVADGEANRVRRIETNLKNIGANYDDEVPVLFPDAPTYREAIAIVWPRIKPLIP